MTFSVASLIACLRDHRLLEGAPEKEIAALQERFTDPRLLAKEMIGRGWLTPFQVNQVFQGRAADLLLGSYVLLERIGEGGMGQVFKARNWKLGKVVALKVIRKERLNNPNIIRRFHREIEAAAKLDHVNIVRAFDAAQIGDIHFFAMEYVEGTDLAKLVRKQGPFAVEAACDTIRQAALGLQQAMERGLTHRDIKPANLLVSGGVVKILDLGLALLQQLDDSEAGTTLTHEGAVMGTPDYMAPEQSLDSHNVDIRADLYSLGCTLYFLLIGRVPFPGGTMTEKLLRHQVEAPKPVEVVRPEVSADLGAVVRKLMARQPEDRYQTPAELADALQELLSSGGCVVRGAKEIASTSPFAQVAVEGDSTTTTTTSTRRVSGWVRWWIGGGLVLAVILVVLLVQLLPSVNWMPKDNGVTAIAVRVDANRPWQDSGIDVQAGTQLTISVRGQWEKKGLGPVPAWGLESVGRERTILQDSAEMCLLGRVGSHEPVPLGKLRTWTPPESGRLFLQANLLNLDQATGNIKVEIKGGTAGTTAMPSPGPTRVESAEAAIPKLLERAEQATEDRQKLRADFLEFGQTYWGTLQAARVARLLIPLASPADFLDPADIPAQELAFAGKGDPLFAPPGLVAILGDSGKQQNAVRTVAVNQDGSHIASAGDDNQVSVWDAATGKRIFLRKGHSDKIQSVAFSLDGRWLASASWDRTVKVWDVLTGKEIGTIPGHSQPVHAVAFSPDGKRLASGGEDKIRIRDPDSDQEVLQIKGNASALAFRPDGKRLAWIAGDSLKVGDPQTGKEILSAPGHAAIVHCLAYSPDGKRLASGSQDKMVKVWDAATGKELHNLAGHSDAVHSVAFRSDGNLLASAGEDGRVILWEIAGRRKLRNWLLPGPVYSVTFTSDGRHLITGNDNGTVYIIRLGPPALVPAPWRPVAKSPLDSHGPDQIPEFEFKEAGQPKDLVAVLGDSRFKHWDRVYRLAFRRGDKELASASADLTVRIWDPASGQVLKILRGHKGLVHQMVYSPDGTLLATAGLEGLVKVWDADSGKEIVSFQDRGNSVYGVAFSHDGKRLVSGGTDKTVKIWDLKAGKVILALTGHRLPIRGIAIHPSRNQLASYSDEEVKVWDLDKGKIQFDYQLEATGIAFSPDGSRLAAGSRGGMVKIWDAAGGAELKKWTGHTNQVFALVFSKDGQHLFTAGHDRIVKMWGTESGKQVKAFPGHALHIYGLAMSNNGKLLASCGEEGAVKVWDIDQGIEVVPTRGHSSAVQSVVVSPDGKWIVSTGQDHKFKIWDTVSGREKHSITAAYSAALLATLSPEGNRLAITWPGHSIKMMDSKAQELLTLAGHSGYIRSIAFSPDGARLASGGDTKNVQVWDTATGQLLLSMKQASHATAIAYNPNGKELAVGDVSGQVQFFNPATGQVQFAMKNGSRVTGMAYSRDGNELAVGGQNATVVVWEMATRKLLFTYKCQGGPIHAVAFSPDGIHLASVDDKHLFLWNGRSGEKVREWPSPGRMRAVTFAPDGRHLLTGNNNGTIYVFRLGTELKTNLGGLHE